MFWNYQRHKGAWRQWTGKPVRAVRRFIRGKAASKGQNKGKGRGKGAGAFLQALSDEECQVFFGKGKGHNKGCGKGYGDKGKGGGKGKRTSGKGFGRKRNPIGADGSPMTCHDCGSEFHFANKCPRGQQQQLGDQQPTYTTFGGPPPPGLGGPLDGLVEQNLVLSTPVLMMAENPVQTLRDWAAPAGRGWQVPEAIPVPSGNSTLSDQRPLPPSGSLADFGSLGASPPSGIDPQAANRVATPAAATAASSTGSWLPVEPTPSRVRPEDFVGRLIDNLTGDAGFPVSPPPAAERLLPQGHDAPPPPTHAPTIPTNILPPWTSFPTMQFATGHEAAAPTIIDVFSETSRLDTASEQQQTIETFHRMNSSTSMFGNLPDRATNLDAAHHRMIDNFHFVSQTIEQRQVDRLSAKGKGKGKGKDVKGSSNSSRTPSEMHAVYFGNNSECTICTYRFSEGERVARLQCQHLFHEGCWDLLVVHDDNEEVSCPNCRAQMHSREAVIAYFNYIPATVDRSSSRAPSYSSAQSQDETEEVLVTFGSYSVNTQVNGHLSMIVDIGAFVNVFGEKLARSLARVGSVMGHSSSQQKLAQPLHIHGVGQGSQVCKWSANMPVAVRTRTPPTAASASGSRGSQDAHDEEVVRLMRVEAPICSGAGSDLPGLLGLRTIEERKGVIETAKGQQFLTFPGPGGYRIVWEPGAIHLPLTKAPSGHLCVELDHFDQIATEDGVETKQVTLLSRVGSSGDKRTAEVADDSLRIADIEDPVITAIPAEQEPEETKYPCTFMVRRRRQRVWPPTQEMPDTQTICGLPCFRGTLSPHHEHAGECRCAHHYRNRHEATADGDG